MSAMSSGHPSICISNGPGSSMSNMNALRVLDLTELRAKYEGWSLTTYMEGDFAGNCLQTMSISHLYQFTYSLETVMIVRLTLRMITQNYMTTKVI
ncbi:hypothetical protein PAAG_00439 [Paracoccidioides lutzii Pb01]|uniref:Uncharacterized protein n=1 Tax=Paracoccidioides lutzii (strain ATCC MYA-826 / Pb01) TaxID=502779 RepID=C1GPJ4_PARBA|nr:hypothetical protein PAAG_00439 [Paracoccidioides lutzii Pb01]EEH36116.2 hypothetical protein PAAG_00439 [Paracoccidioides lutzii Pb01]